MSDSKVSIELVERRARASTNTALVQQCRHVLTMCRTVASTVLVHTYSHQGLQGNEIADALAKAAANGIARREGAAQSCREWLSRWSGDPSPREHAHVVNLEAALFWHEVSENQQRADDPPRAEASAIEGGWENQTNGLVPSVRESARAASCGRAA